MISAWHHANAQPKVGHPFVYSDTAVECLLVLRELFQLPYRQTEGLGQSLVELMEISLDIPDYTSLAKRAAKLGISLDVRRHRGAIDVVVDSTGLKVFGEGEWKMRKHGKSKRRTWRKLHLAVNPQTQEIEAETLTENNCDDASQVDPMLDQVPGRTKAIREIRRRGRRHWKESVGYHRRSLSETAMYRMKCCFGDHLKNRLIENQRTETRLRSKILNKFTHLGLPKFVWS